MNESGKNRGCNRGRGRFQYYRGRRNFQYRSGASRNQNRDVNVSDNSGIQQVITSVVQCMGPYKGWKLYFPNQAFVENSDKHKKIKASEEYFTRNKSSFTVILEKYSYIQLDLAHVLQDEDFMTNWTTFSDELYNEPRETLDCLGLAAHHVFDADNKIMVRPLNHNPVLPLTSLKVNYFGKLVTIRGTVIRVGSPGLICKTMAFECLSCYGTQALPQPQGIITFPVSCISCHGFSKFEPLQSSPFTITFDCQIAKIQESQNQDISGSIPRSVEIELYDDLVGLASPGDLISITGIVQVREENRGDDNKLTSLMQIYIEVISLHNQKTLNHPTLTFTLKDYYAIQEIHASDNIFKLLVQSLCPSIFGNEIVKAGLILGLFGGTEIEDGSRSNPHILIVGDPGLGKSQMLQAATVAAPRGVYVCGNACTVSGLTVSLSRAEGGGFTLEAGALVLSDHGICCVDELDKFNVTGHGALLEAMEQGSVSIARGGVVCRLAAAPTVLAAANPLQGHYDRSKTVCENLHMSAPLLSRFDLVFILLDNPNNQLDSLLSDHVLAKHTSDNLKNVNTSDLDSTLRSNDGNERLINRLKLSNDEEFHQLPIELLRKYIAYAKKYVHPKLNDDANMILKDFYLKLRESHKSNIGGAPITTRQLEACIRLTQARARVCLKEEATAEDAKDVVEIMKYSLLNTLCDEFGTVQMDRSVHGSGISSKSHVKKFIAAIMQHVSKSGKDIFSRSELLNIHKQYKLTGDGPTLIESLHVHGYLLLKGSNMYKVLTV